VGTKGKYVGGKTVSFASPTDQDTVLCATRVKGPKTAAASRASTNKKQDEALIAVSGNRRDYPGLFAAILAFLGSIASQMGPAIAAAVGGLVGCLLWVFHACNAVVGGLAGILLWVFRACNAVVGILVRGLLWVFRTCIVLVGILVRGLLWVFRACIISLVGGLLFPLQACYAVVSSLVGCLLWVLRACYAVVGGLVGGLLWVLHACINILVGSLLWVLKACNAAVGSLVGFLLWFLLAFKTHLDTFVRAATGAVPKVASSSPVSTNKEHDEATAAVSENRREYPGLFGALFSTFGAITNQLGQTIVAAVDSMVGGLFCVLHACKSAAKLATSPRLWPALVRAAMWSLHEAAVLVLASLLAVLTTTWSTILLLSCLCLVGKFAVETQLAIVYGVSGLFAAATSCIFHGGHDENEKESLFTRVGQLFTKATKADDVRDGPVPDGGDEDEDDHYHDCRQGLWYEDLVPIYQDVA